MTPPTRPRPASQLSRSPGAGSAEALGALDRRFTAGAPYLLVAHHAATEAGVIFNQREHCPALARVDFINTVTLARQFIPDLPNHQLDMLLAHFSISTQQIVTGLRRRRGHRAIVLPAHPCRGRHAPVQRSRGPGESSRAHSEMQHPHPSPLVLDDFR